MDSLRKRLQLSKQRQQRPRFGHGGGNGNGNGGGGGSVVLQCVLVVLLLFSLTTFWQSFRMIQQQQQQQQQQQTQYYYNKHHNVPQSLQDFKQQYQQLKEQEQGFHNYWDRKTYSRRDNNNINNNNNNDNDNNNDKKEDITEENAEEQVPEQVEEQVEIDINHNHNNINDDDNDDVLEIDQPESPIPNPTILPNGNDTFSACLLVMDDNHRLVEWMAYHYHVLPLRYLIIAVDPRSNTSPTKILNKYRKLGMHIEEWNDHRFMKAQLADQSINEETDGLQIKRDRHRIRQRNFYWKCLQHLKNQNRTFVTLIDTDEYLTYNHKGGDQFQQWEQHQQQLQQQNKRFATKQRIVLSQPPPTTAEEGGLIKFIHREQQHELQMAANNDHDAHVDHENPAVFFNRSCISCPRLQFGAKESNPEQVTHMVPSSMTHKAERFDTLRYRDHAHREDFVANGLSKSILDVSKIDRFPRITSLHRPIRELCVQPWVDDWTTGLRINHYVGSWEGKSKTVIVLFSPTCFRFCLGCWL